jgi:hypothetical protein
MHAFKTYNLKCMMKTTTQNELLSYAYNETGLIDSDRIQRSIDGDPIVAGEFNEIISVMDMLDKAVPEIKQATIEKILQFC